MTWQARWESPYPVCSASKVVRVKLNNTFVIFDRGELIHSKEWDKSHAAIASAIAEMSWPLGSKGGLVIPQIVSINPGNLYTNKRGKVVTWKGGSKKAKKKKTLRNGVVPLRQQFRANLEASSGWRAEEPLSFKEYFEKVRSKNKHQLIARYPIASAIAEPGDLHEGVGDFDFWLKSDTGFRTVVEWETGNISSSHRSLNKMCLALMGGLVDAAVLIVPSFYLYPHLTDRIGNIRELEPYFYFWGRIGQLVETGLLAIIEAEQDGLIKSTDVPGFYSNRPRRERFRAS